MGGVEEDLGPDLIGDLADFGDRVGEEVQAAADGDDLRAHGMGEVGESFQISHFTLPFC